MADRPLPSPIPYWWEEAPPQRRPEKPVARSCDVAIVGAGYTGLSAAITLARAGRSVEVFDRELPGAGASTRNGGMASGSLRPGLGELTRQFGAERGRGVLMEAKLAREDLARFIKDEGIDCDFALTGRFTGADSPAAFTRLEKDAEMLVREFGIEARAIPRSQQQDYVGTDLYHGGLARTDIGGLHPAKLHAGMMKVALAAGAVVHGETAVASVEPNGARFRVSTARGVTDAGAVIMATNGYTDRVDQWLRRRLVPVRSRIIATAPLSNNLMRQLMPKAMMLGDTRRLHYYFRPSPDGTRILYGGRDGAITGQGRQATAVLRRGLLQVFPILEDVEVTHSWYGHVAMNRDMIPRVFTNRGMEYAVGYCGSGVVWAPWAGRKAAMQILDPQSTPSALDFQPPRAVPFYDGRPWFMPGVFAWLRLRDALDRMTIRRG
jgi:glycine/D-amino acid oxidase-like deaminating enzyme